MHLFILGFCPVQSFDFVLWVALTITRYFLVRFLIIIIYLSPTGGQLQKNGLVSLIHSYIWALKHCPLCNRGWGNLNNYMKKQWQKIGTSPFYHTKKDSIFIMCKLACDFTYSSSLKKLHWCDKRTITSSVPHEKTKDIRGLTELQLDTMQVNL